MKSLIVVLSLIGLRLPLFAQDVGLSFSYFIPRNGYFSTPVSPFSIRGLGVNINRFLAVQTGASLYRMSGLSVKDQPLPNKAPFVGPNFTLFVPAELVFQLKGSKVEVDVKGGGFFFYGFGQTLNYGNIDRAIREKEGWAVANSTLAFQNKPGYGYHGGVELTVHVTQQVGVSIETNYLVGQSKLPLTGSYSGGSSTIATVPVDYKDAKVDFSGLEFSIGLIFNSGGGNKPKQKRRR
ncbi:MAG TPA: hypothetical protein VK517_05170 [Cyclobacteriaceae bacterium]|jgi:hypothetical protein|nr:hypothetical protein [Cyclobacteriaceae bacterium]